MVHHQAAAGTHSACCWVGVPCVFCSTPSVGQLIACMCCHRSTAASVSCAWRVPPCTFM
jgi:hypothetical protein